MKRVRPQGYRRPQLYTSLVRAKRAMNDGHLPPMTPLRSDAMITLDPAFTIGMGALNEDTVLGLQCPVRGCGRWFHKLSIHLLSQHADIGGQDAVKALLGIPRRTRLASTSLKQRARETTRLAIQEGRLHVPDALRAYHVRPRTAESTAVRVAGLQATHKTMNHRNFRDQCEAQIAHKFIDLHHKLGRTPSFKEAAHEYGARFVSAVQKLYGSWNNALSQQGLEAHRYGKRYSRERVLEALGEWYAAHGRMPRMKDLRSPTRTPLCPTPATITKAMKQPTFPEAVDAAARALGIIHQTPRRRSKRQRQEAA